MAVYTPQDYIVAIVILATLLYLLKSYFFKKVSFDEDFIKALPAPILLAILIRMLADAGVVEKSQWWSVTPGIYIVGVAYGVAVISLSMALAPRLKLPYWKITLALGALVALPVLLKLYQQMHSPARFFLPLAMAGFLTLLVYLVSFLHPSLEFLRVRYSHLVLFAHFLDASGTFIGIDFLNFSEEHILAEYFINLTGTAMVMFPLKLLVVGFALYVIEKWYEEEGEELYYKIIKVTMFVLGVGPGLRNALLLTLAG